MVASCEPIMLLEMTFQMLRGQSVRENKLEMANGQLHKPHYHHHPILFWTLLRTVEKSGLALMFGNTVVKVIEVE